MKKIYLILSFAAFAFTASAQLNLTGTYYFQNFDTLATNGLPAGWGLYTGATSTSLGTSGAKSYLTNGPAYYDTSFATGCYYCGCGSDVVGGAFKNAASGDIPGIDTSSCTEQTNATDRAMSVRQSSKFGDPGASFVLELANTTGISNIFVAFHFQNLDITSGRTVSWTLDYGVGAAPTAFTPITPLTGTMISTGSTFVNDSVAALLPAAAYNQSTPVWIRISALSASTGSGDRPTTAIADFGMVYNNVNSVPTISAPAQVAVKAIGFATSTNVTLGYSVAKAGQYNVGLYDITGREVSTQSVELTPGGSNINLTGLNLASGLYIARIYNNVSSGTAKVIVQ